MTDMDEIISRLQLEPHPEGGFYRETFRSDATLPSGRALATSILFLLPSGVTSHWHRVDAEELWIHQAGADLDLHVAEDGQAPVTHHLGPGAPSRPQVLVPRSHWQSAQSRGDWTLAACVVTPGFLFEGFEMAPEGWSPPG